MSTTLNNINDFLDDDIHKTLERLGVIFPKSVADFKIIEEEAIKKNLKQPEQLKDPFKFLNQQVYKKDTDIGKVIEEKVYSKNLAQAAREGKEISEEIKKKMFEDKLKFKK